MRLAAERMHRAMWAHGGVAAQLKMSSGGVRSRKFHVCSPPDALNQTSNAEGSETSQTPFLSQTTGTREVEEANQARDMEVCKQEIEPGLYLVSTPIGNLGDITLRALKVLRSAACIFAEDTRRSAVLLQAFSIRCPLISCHAHNEKQQSVKVVQRISQGQVVALISDAGTPCISDPGLRIVQAVIENGLTVVPVPGASAVLAALVASGLNTDSFLFVGFLPDKKGQRKRKLKDLTTSTCTIVIYVSPHDLPQVLEDCADVFGDEWSCCLAKELTKIHEDFDRGTLPDLAMKYSNLPIKGEAVLLLSPTPKSNKLDPELVGKLLDDRLASGDSLSRAVRSVASELNLGRTQVYQLAIERAGIKDPPSS